MQDETDLPLGGMPLEVFLRDYWQKKPCLIRQAFAGFKPMLDENDIAGLACEEGVDARLVMGNMAEANWSVAHGPFTEARLAALPERDWCLLVQDVEKHYPPLQSLLSGFDFLPNWRLDDLMVSVSATGGSVGPHVDQYDVFLLQASGQRRWQVSDEFNPACLDDCDLRVLREFSPQQEWLLQAGDMLYLPPGLAHYGLALELGMTWSIGLRAPSQADLFQALGDWLTDQHAEGRRYRDPEMMAGHQVSRQTGEISPAELRQLSSLFAVTTPSAEGYQQDMDEFLASFISRFRLAQFPAPAEQQLEGSQLHQALSTGSWLQRNPWTRLHWIRQGQQARLFAAGEGLSCSQQLAGTLCGPALRELQWQQWNSSDQDCILELLNQGHLYLQHADP